MRFPGSPSAACALISCSGPNTAGGQPWRAGQLPPRLLCGQQPVQAAAQVCACVWRWRQRCRRAEARQQRWWWQQHGRVNRAGGARTPSSTRACCPAQQALFPARARVCVRLHGACLCVRACVRAHDLGACACFMGVGRSCAKMSRGSPGSLIHRTNKRRRGRLWPPVCVLRGRPRRWACRTLRRKSRGCKQPQRVGGIVGFAEMR